MIRTTLVLSATLALVASATLSRAQSAQPVTGPLEGVGVEQRLGDSIPLDTQFTDSSGRVVRLRDCFHGRPVLLTPVYYKCPMLCAVTLNQLGRSLNGLSEDVGASFDIVTFSFDPRETPQLAEGKKRSQLKAYRRPSAEQGWSFLTGSEPSIRALTDAIGFHYKWDEPSQQYVHPGALVVLTPSGKISRYFLGVDYPPSDLRAALDEAGRDAVGPPAERVFLYCFRYDPATGKYGLIISRSLRAMGAFLVVALAGLTVALNRMHARRTRGGPALTGEAHGDR
jgi:protein SCO1/2